jgi:hypothetical protein
MGYFSDPLDSLWSLQKFWHVLKTKPPGPNPFEPLLECGQYLDFVSGSLHIVYKASLNHGGYPHSLHYFYNTVYDQYAQESVEETGRRTPEEGRRELDSVLEVRGISKGEAEHRLQKMRDIKKWSSAEADGISLDRGIV